MKGKEKKLDFLVENTENMYALLCAEFMRDFWFKYNIKKGFSLLTEKRVYIKNKCYRKQNSDLKKVALDTVYELKDIKNTVASKERIFNDLLISIYAFILCNIVLSIYNINPELIKSLDMVSEFLNFALIVCPTAVIFSLWHLYLYIFKSHRVLTIIFESKLESVVISTKYISKESVEIFQERLQYLKIL